MSLNDKLKAVREEFAKTAPPELNAWIVLRQAPPLPFLPEDVHGKEVVIMPVTIFEANPDLVRFQMDVAEAFGKPIIGVKSFGDTVAIQKEIIDRCADIIEWNERTMIEAIKRLGRNEETAQWEVIDFDLD